MEAKITERTRCVWDYFLSRRQMWLNPKWDGGVVDDKVRGKERLIFPRPEEVRWWAEGFGRSDEEMNEPPPAPPRSSAQEAVTEKSTEAETPNRSQAVGGGEGELASFGPVHQPSPLGRSPVLIGVETSEQKIGITGTRTSGELKAVHSDSALSRRHRRDTHTPPPPSVPQKTDGNEAPAPSTPSTPSPQTGTGSPPTREDHQASSGQAQVSEDPLADLSDDLDPLGIGEVKDRAPRVVNRSRLREQMEILMQ